MQQERGRMKKRYTYKEDEYVICPFYKKEDPTEIKCAGIVGKATTNSFGCKKEKDEHKADFCNALYRSCPVYIAIEKEE